MIENIPQRVTNFMHEQGKMNMMMFEQLQAMNEKLSRLGLGDSNNASTSSDKGKLPSQPSNPNQEAKSVHILRSGTKYTGPEMPNETETVETEEIAPNLGKSVGSSATSNPEITNQKHTDPHKDESASKNQQNKDNGTEEDASQNKDSGKATPTLPPYRPPVPFPQRLAKNRLDDQFSKFMEVLKQLTISIPFTDALLQMPSYAKFLKDILTNKRSLKDCKNIQ